MQHDALKLIAQYYQRFNARDWPGFLDLLCDDVHHDINQGGCEIGKETFAIFLKRMDRCYSEQIVDLSITANAEGTRAAAEFVVLGTYQGSDDGLPPACGQKYRLPAGAFFAIRDGKVARISNYYNLQDWLRQVGS